MEMNRISTTISVSRNIFQRAASQEDHPTERKCTCRKRDLRSKIPSRQFLTEIHAAMSNKSETLAFRDSEMRAASVGKVERVGRLPKILSQAGIFDELSLPGGAFRGCSINARIRPIKRLSNEAAFGSARRNARRWIIDISGKKDSSLEQSAICNLFAIAYIRRNKHFSARAQSISMNFE